MSILRRVRAIPKIQKKMRILQKLLSTSNLKIFKMAQSQLRKMVFPSSAAEIVHRRRYERLAKCQWHIICVCGGDPPIAAAPEQEESE